jgi:hypothetical protein
MEPEYDQDPEVKKDLHNLTVAVKKDGLDPEVMFAKKRGIRSVTPPFEEAAPASVSVTERLRRVQQPED